MTLAAADPEGVSPIHWDFLEAATDNQDLPGGAVDGDPTEAAGEGADDIADADVVDHGLFTVEGGVLKFKDAPDFESPAGGIGNDSNTYNVVVRASDGGAGNVAGRPGWVQYFKVTVTVLDVEEDREGDLDRRGSDADCPY